LLGHISTVESVTITSDNKFIVSGSYDSTIRLWNPQDKLQEAVLKSYTSGVKCIAITSENKFMTSGGYNNTVHVWNLQEKCQEAVLKGHKGMYAL
jgi:WD40 repeat protein